MTMYCILFFRYIEFYDVMSVPMAIALSGQPLLGQPVMVKPSEAEKNLVQSTTSVANGLTGLIGPYSGGARKLYVGNLHISITEADIRRVSTSCFFLSLDNFCFGFLCGLIDLLEWDLGREYIIYIGD